jgi:hypothetical protein
MDEPPWRGGMEKERQQMIKFISSPRLGGSFPAGAIIQNKRAEPFWTVRPCLK